MMLSGFGKKVMLVGAGFVLLVAVSVIFVMASNQAKAAETVKLSNGREIKVGQSVKSMKKSLGTTVRMVTNEIYRYPADTKSPAEVTIFADQSKVTGIMISRGAGNSQVGKSVRLGQSGKQLQSTFGKKLDDINTSTGFVAQKGYKVTSGNSVSYYVTESCSSDKYDRVTVLAISKKGEESRMTFLGKKRECSQATTQPGAAK